MDTSNEYRTSDLQMASFLKLRGHNLLRVEGPVGRKVFVFGNVTAADLSSYYVTAVLAPDLFSAYRIMKGELFGRGVRS